MPVPAPVGDGDILIEESSTAATLITDTSHVRCDGQTVNGAQAARVYSR